jgi:hypothetical protein
VVGEDLSPQPVIYALAVGFWHGVTRSSVSGGDNSDMCSFPQFFINRDALTIAVDNLP